MMNRANELRTCVSKFWAGDVEEVGGLDGVLLC